MKKMIKYCKDCKNCNYSKTLKHLYCYKHRSIVFEHTISKAIIGCDEKDYERVVSAVGNRDIPIVKYSLKRDKYEIE